MLSVKSRGMDVREGVRESFCINSIISKSIYLILIKIIPLISFQRGHNQTRGQAAECWWDPTAWNNTRWSYEYSQTMRTRGDSAGWIRCLSNGYVEKWGFSSGNHLCCFAACSWWAILELIVICYAPSSTDILFRTVSLILGS